VYLARVFVSRSARMACNDCGGYRKGLVLSPPAGFYAETRPPYVSFLLSAGGFSLLRITQPRGWLLTGAAGIREGYNAILGGSETPW